MAGELNWSEITKDDSVEVQRANTQNAVLSLRDKSVAFVTATKPWPTPWFTRNHKRAKARKDRAYALLMKYNTPAHFAALNTEAARLHRLIRNAKYYYDRRLAGTSSNSSNPFLLTKDVDES